MTAARVDEAGPQAGPVPGVAGFTVVGTPGERRVRRFGEALARRGLPEPRVVPWQDVLGGRPLGLTPGAVVRIESPGGDPEVDALLRGPGEPTRVGDGSRWYGTLLAGLERVRAAAAEAGSRLLNDPDEIAVMFDKRRCHRTLGRAGVPVPEALPAPVGSYAELRARMREAGWTRVFVKPCHGSSASGVIAFQTHRDQIKATTSVEWLPGGPGHPMELHNSLKVRTYTEEAAVAAIVDALAPHGLHVERWFPKASLAGRVIDLRVVVVAGTPTHAVVRQSHGPITNLHLGGSRGDLAAVRDRLTGRAVPASRPGEACAAAPSGWDRALDVCARAAACFPRSLVAGVDLMIGTDWRSLAVAEVNAFGDLLPGLTGLPGGVAEGLDTYEAQIEAVLAGAAHPANRPWTPRPIAAMIAEEGGA